MSEIDFSRLNILVADDFSNFRSTVTSMLGKFGVQQADAVSNGEEVLTYCQKKRYDLILCDYELGKGRSGQQVLEELRHRGIIDHKTIFIMVSADATKDAVMSAYDCEPDDYLMKPITAKMLHHRVSRLVSQRKHLNPVYKAMEAGDNATAIRLLIDLSLAENRNAVAAQKLLGEVFIQEKEYGKAEKLYTKALEARQVDWARLGLAKVKQLKGDLTIAGEWLEQIVEDNPLYLPAYDVLAENWQQVGDSNNVQSTVQRSVYISPKSILRQKHLAEVAESNGDFSTALGALRSTLRLGQLSCHASAEDNLNFARMAATVIEKKIEPATPLSTEAIDALDSAKKRFTLNEDQLNRANLIGGRNYALAGDMPRAQELIDMCSNSSLDESLEASVARVCALQAIGEQEKAEKLIDALLEKYEYDQDALERIDSLLSEPVSENNRALVTSINAEGIDLYNQHRYDEAITCFNRAKVLFPKHVGIQLNIIQALIGKIKSGYVDPATVSKIESDLTEIELLIETDHPQYDRFVRLKSMAAANLAK